MKKLKDFESGKSPSALDRQDKATAVVLGLGVGGSAGISSGGLKYLESKALSESVYNRARLTSQMVQGRPVELTWKKIAGPDRYRPIEEIGKVSRLRRHLANALVRKMPGGTLPIVNHVPDFTKTGELMLESVRPLNRRKLALIAAAAGLATGLPVAIGTGVASYVTSKAKRQSRNLNPLSIEELKQRIVPASPM